MSTNRTFTFHELAGEFSVCGFGPEDHIPDWVPLRGFMSITSTGEELSIVCSSKVVPSSTRAEHGWCCLKLQGPIPFDQVGVVAEISSIIAATGSSIFVLSTFDTDYILVKVATKTLVINALEQRGHLVFRVPMASASH